MYAQLRRPALGEDVFSLIVRITVDFIFISTQYAFTLCSFRYRVAGGFSVFFARSYVCSSERAATTPVQISRTPERR